MFFNSQTVHLQNFTRVYVWQYFAYFLGMLSNSYVGNVGNCGNDLKSRGVHTSLPFRTTIVLYITNLKSYLGSRNNCLQLPTNSYKPLPA